MRIALFSDIHANREAFEACLAGARETGFDAVALLGDYVGYCADPEWATDKVMELTAAGAVAVLGNHDAAIAKRDPGFNPVAQLAIEWTRKQLSLPQQDFLQSLPLAVEQGDRLLVHADASKPAAWHYVDSVDTAAQSLRAVSSAITICGHIHRPAIYSMSATEKMTAFTPVTDVPIPLLPNRKWLVVLGAVGQPRDGNPDASYAILDTERTTVTYRRAAYDVDKAARKIVDAGLPFRVADRLRVGQ